MMNNELERMCKDAVLHNFMLVQPHDTLNLKQDLNPRTFRIRSMNVISILLLLLLLHLLTLQPYTGFCPLHQVIPGFSICDDVAQISQF